MNERKDIEMLIHVECGYALLGYISDKLISVSFSFVSINDVIFRFIFESVSDFEIELMQEIQTELSVFLAVDDLSKLIYQVEVFEAETSKALPFIVFHKKLYNSNNNQKDPPVS